MDGQKITPYNAQSFVECETRTIKLMLNGTAHKQELWSYRKK
jgi:hypothetical protein